MSAKAKIRELIGKDLKNFEIIEMTEVYRVDDDGRRAKSLGFFRIKDVAEAFAGLQTDANWHRTAPAVVLTDGKIGYVIDQQDPVKLFNDGEEILEIKKKAIAKLSPAERKLLRLE